MSRLINNQLWNARSFANLSVEDKLLFLYLETSPETNYYGVFILPTDGVISARTGLSPQKVKSSLEELQKKGKISLVEDYLIIFDYFDRQKNNESEKTKKGLENFEKSLPQAVYEAWLKGRPSPHEGGIKGVSSPHEESKVKESKVKENKTNESNYPFESFWELYQRKGSKKLARDRYQKLTEAQRELIFQHVPKYQASREKRYWKDAERYISHETWESEIIDNTDTKDDWDRMIESIDNQMEEIIKEKQKQYQQYD
jgi:DNA-binding MarR family transcriptional regulator